MSILQTWKAISRKQNSRKQTALLAAMTSETGSRFSTSLLCQTCRYAQWKPKKRRNSHTKDSQAWALRETPHAASGSEALAPGTTRLQTEVQSEFAMFGQSVWRKKTIFKKNTKRGQTDPEKVAQRRGNARRPERKPHLTNEAINLSSGGLSLHLVQGIKPPTAHTHTHTSWGNFGICSHLNVVAKTPTKKVPLKLGINFFFFCQSGTIMLHFTWNNCSCFGCEVFMVHLFETRLSVTQSEEATHC